MLYFAYGSNLNLVHLAACLASHGNHPDDVENPQRAILPGHDRSCVPESRRALRWHRSQQCVEWVRN
ncbi:MAG: hypothetical protein KAV82_04280 [Phycisphaerae bacterium]|nr:hypothetical protein [Phycisphaerae bacterium]